MSAENITFYSVVSAEIMTFYNGVSAEIIPQPPVNCFGPNTSCHMTFFSLLVCLSERLKVGIGHTITVPMDIMSVLVAVLNVSATMKPTIIAMHENEL